MADQQSNIPEKSMQEIPYGYCHCGCGQKTNISLVNSKSKGLVNGQPKQFLKYHQKRGENHHNWRGGKNKHGKYWKIYQPYHPRADNRGYVLEHIIIAEKILGKLLPAGAVVHHIDDNPGNNNSDNLVICENEKYHRLLHQRKRGLENCGHGSWRKCVYCKKYDAPEKLVIRFHAGTYHQDCANKCQRERRKQKLGQGGKA